MSEVAIRHEGGGARHPFTRRAALMIAGVGVVAFVLMLVLGAYAPDLQSGKNGGTHALSKAATGFSGIVRLAEAGGLDPEIVRGSVDGEEDGRTMIISPDSDQANLTDLLDGRGGEPTLIVLPKWRTVPSEKTKGWVTVDGLHDADVPQGVLAPANQYKVFRRKPTAGETLAGPDGIVLPAPKILQTMSGKGITPVVVDRNGRIVVGQMGDDALYVLADPDLLNNHGIADREQAMAGLRLVEYFEREASSHGLLFDVTANGLGAQRSPLKLAFDPPFLAVTLAIAAALLLAGWQALVRFGAPLKPERAIAFGKAALVDNSAALIRKAGREAHFGGRYAALVRDRAAARLGLKPATSEVEIDERLDALDPANPFSALAARANEAATPAALLLAARALHRWQQEVMT